jgi:DNA-binding response OmpR family regulator
LPVLIVSALACERLERDLTAIGAQRLLGKPFSVKGLCAVVRELLDEPQDRTRATPEAAGRIHRDFIAPSRGRSRRLATIPVVREVRHASASRVYPL